MTNKNEENLWLHVTSFIDVTLVASLMGFSLSQAVLSAAGDALSGRTVVNRLRTLQRISIDVWRDLATCAQIGCGGVCVSFVVVVVVPRKPQIAITTNRYKKAQLTQGLRAPPSSYPLVVGAPLGVKPSDLRNDPWWPKTRITGQSESERMSICSAFLIQYTRVTDGRTDGQTELAWYIRAIAYMPSRVKITTNQSLISCCQLWCLHVVLWFVSGRFLAHFMS